MSSSEWKKQRIDDYDKECDKDCDASAYLVDDMETVKSVAYPGPWTSMLRTTACFLSAIVFCFMILLMYFQIAYRRPAIDDQDIRKSMMAFRGVDDVSYEQEVTVSPSGDYVMYHVKQPNEETWIFDNYVQGYRLMKVASLFDQICYVTPMNSTRSELDNAGLTDQQTAVDSEATANRKKRQTTFYVDETREMVLSQLGKTALELCLDIPSYWIYPTISFSRNHEEFARTHGRDKRNVKKCVVSCCEMVCCCNQKWLQWQSHTMFNCHNVCHGCTSKSNMDVTNLC